MPYFYITGGDPILHPDFWRLLSLIKEHEIPFTILGNPFHLTDEVCRLLKSYGCQKYQLSLDGMRETHDWFRKPGSFDCTLEKIGCIKRAGIRSVIMTTVSGTNIKEIPFDAKQIEETVLQQILQAGLYAPSAGGRQGVILAVCQDKEINERLGKIKRANSNPRMATPTSYVSKEQPSIADDPKLVNTFYDAPTVITMFAPKNFLFASEDCAVTAENMMLAADSLGVGSCYIGQGWTAFADTYGQEILHKWGIRTDYYAVMQLLLGYPKPDGKHPTAKPRKNDRILRF